ncbi:FadR/GntR family transcriptional regulator [Thetidibacter halocola]|uniref:FadR family transcriptional regulator n=1 Tax=Thetidibacter halocola TaxID=2827239 RepID=A0A8J7WDA5_9RHOB|nr:FCD domain-containing protein [Thetidibacter halocola]MBS0124334.1 FadR family transcriptional regulator [Thetidibacter halocola]
MTAPPTAILVRSHVLALIRSGRLGPGNRLPTERVLCETTGAPRRVVRRALASLEAEGLIWRHQGKGTFAGQPAEPIGVLAAEVNGPSHPIEVMEARLCIEPELAALCALRCSAEDIQRMWALARHQYEAEDDDVIELWDSALHRMIAKSARNRPLQTAFALLDEIRATAEWQDLRALSRSTRSLGESRAQHQQIIAAIAARDPDGARAAMCAHLMARHAAMEAALVALAGEAAQAFRAEQGTDDNQGAEHA